MAKLTWHNANDNRYETGVEQGVLFVAKDTVGTAPGVKGANYYENGVAWNGLSSVSENPTGADNQTIYADNVKYLTMQGAEDFEGSIECYTVPKAFYACDGLEELDKTSSAKSGLLVGQQIRKKFAMAYITRVGSELNAKYSEKLHIVYACSVTPSERSYSTVNDSPEATALSYSFSSVPVGDTIKYFDSNGAQQTKDITTSLVTIDKAEVGDTKWNAILEQIYGKDPTTTGGSDGIDPHVLYPSEIQDIIMAE